MIITSEGTGVRRGDDLAILTVEMDLGGIDDRIPSALTVASPVA